MPKRREIVASRQVLSEARAMGSSALVARAPIHSAAQRAGVIDAEAAVDRREQAIAVHAPLDGLFGFAVCCANDLAHLEAAAGEEDAHRPRPVVATRAAAGVLVRNLRRPSEFAA